MENATASKDAPPSEAILEEFRGAIAKKKDFMKSLQDELVGYAESLDSDTREQEPVCWINGHPVFEGTTDEDMGRLRSTSDPAPPPAATINSTRARQAAGPRMMRTPEEAPVDEEPLPYNPPQDAMLKRRIETMAKQNKSQPRMVEMLREKKDHVDYAFLQPGGVGEDYFLWCAQRLRQGHKDFNFEQ